MSLIKRPPVLKMAPPGSHVVTRQARISKKGIRYFVKAHVRKNRGKKIVLLPENLLYLFRLNYWQEFGLPFPEKLDPMIVKVMIAVESSFRPKVGAKESSAFGLMQITNKTRKDILNINDGILDLERKDLEDPVINIAMGIRWISYKYSSIGKGVKKDLYNTVKYYYDKSKGDEYAHKILNLYNLSNRS